MCVNAYGLVCSGGHSDSCYFESGINAKGGFGDGRGCRGFYVGRKDANDDKREYLKRRERTKVFFLAYLLPRTFGLSSAVQNNTKYNQQSMPPCECL